MKPTHVTRGTASAIDHIITNSIMHTGFKSGTIKTEVFDVFPVFFCCKYISVKEDAKKEFVHKCKFSSQSSILTPIKLGLSDMNVFHKQFLITCVFSVSLKFRACYITGQWGEFTVKNATLCLHMFS